MRSDVALLWETVATELQECSTGSVDGEAALETVDALLYGVQDHPPPCKAVWIEVVQTMQV
jgi:hypothetical protein